MALPQGIDFRGTAGFVTDPTNCDMQATYPHTSVQGNTVGWEDAVSTADRVAYAGTQARVSGINFIVSATRVRFRIDLPSAGNYQVRVGAGDASAQNDVKVEMFDTTTSLGVIVGLHRPTTDQFYDATNTLRTSHSDWDTNNALSGSLTFATTICRYHIGGDTLTSAFVIAHVWIEAAAVASGQSAVSPMPFYNTISIQE